MLPPHLRSGARPQAILRKLRGAPRSGKQPRPQHARHAAKDFPKAQRRLPPPGQRQRVSQLPPDVTKEELKIVFTTYGLVTVRTKGQRYDTGGVRTHIQDKSAGAQEHARARERACVFRVQSQRPPPPRQRQHVSQLPPCVTKEELKMVFTTYGRVTVRTEGQRADTNRSHQTATPPARRRTTLPARTMRKRGSSCRCSSRMRRDSAPIPTISAQTWRTPVSRTSGAVQPADRKHKQNASGGKKQQDTPTQREPSPQVGASGLQG